ncbi:unnamed protein product, partial [Aspergillus niger]
MENEKGEIVDLYVS